MQEPLEKRKRAANFSEEEKMKFVRLLQEKSDIIIYKVTSHDTRTNKRKEESWEFICRDLNSSGSVLRNTDTLKKQWQLLKSDAKIFKSVAAQQVRGTGGGPSIKIDNPVLELVVEMTGRGSSGISGVSVCDSDHLPVQYLETVNEKGDESKPLSAVPQPPTPALAAVQVPLFEISILLDEHVQIVIEVPTYTENSEHIITCVSTHQNTKCNTPVNHQNPKSLKRRRPLLDSVSNERSEPARAQINYSNSFASERLRSERAKLELIQLKIGQDTEFHKVRMENEQRIHLLKEKILEKILKKVEVGDQLDADIIQVAFSTAGERSKEK